MKHIAIIMDGNRRWARKNKMQAVIEGHRKGVESVKRAILWSLENKLQYLSLFAFSLENTQRSDQEKNDIFELIIEGVKAEKEWFMQHRVAISFVGERSMFPKMAIESIEEIEKATKVDPLLSVQVMFFYGAQQELTYATKLIASKVKAGQISVEEITTQTLKDALWTAGIPDPDMVIRPGGYSRLSNFLLFQSAYSEWFFLEKLWPDFNEQDLTFCVDQFYAIRRNFGH